MRASTVGLAILKPFMEYGKNRTVASGIEELVGVPTGREGTGFSFAVPNNTTDNQVRIIKSGAISVGQGIAKFPAFMNRSGGLGCHMTRNAIWPGKLPKQPMQSVSAALNRGIALGVRSFEVAVRNDARTAMAGTDDVDHVQIIVFDQPVEMDIEEIQSCCRPPMTKQTGLDMFELEGVSSNGLSCR